MTDFIEELTEQIDTMPFGVMAELISTVANEARIFTGDGGFLLIDNMGSRFRRLDGKVKAALRKAFGVEPEPKPAPQEGATPT